MANQNIPAPARERNCGVRRRPSAYDRISQLPDDILILILSFLTFKDVASTSLLSRRWRSLWMWINGCLDFDISVKMDNLMDMGPKMRLKVISSYVNCISRVMALHRGSSVDELRIVPILKDRLCIQLDEWLRFAFNKGVKKLELDFRNNQILLGRRCILPNIIPELGDPRTRGVSLFVSIIHPYWSFRCLKSLSVRHASVSEKAVNYFLSDYGSIEHFCLENSDYLVRLNVTSIHLKYLEIIHCSRLKHLEISSQNLVSFTFDGRKISAPFKSVCAHLVELVIGEKYTRSLVSESQEHLIYISQVKTLKCQVSTSSHARICSFPSAFPKMMNLRHLELQLLPTCHESFWGYMAIIKASPVLTTLRMKYEFGAHCSYIWVHRAKPAFRYSHHCLKEVELVGFHSCSAELNFAWELLDAAVVLEKIVFRFDPLRRNNHAFRRAERLSQVLTPGAIMVIF